MSNNRVSNRSCKRYPEVKVQYGHFMDEQEFANLAIQLCKILRSIDSSHVVLHRFDVVHWRAEEMHGNVRSMVHPPVVRKQVCLNKAGYQPPDVGLLEDESLAIDPDSCVDDGSKSIEYLWNFSVVFSETWRVPVLYFEVAKRSGERCTHSEVINLLVDEPKPALKTPSEYLSFLSFDEHPVTGFPALFLHPCGTEARMSELQGTMSCSNRLWSWMAMSLSLLGFHIPVKLFWEVSVLLESTTS